MVSGMKTMNKINLTSIFKDLIMGYIVKRIYIRM